MKRKKKAMPSSKSINLIILEHQIAACRRKMEALWEARGYTDSVVLAISIELDELLNKHQKLVMRRKAR